MVCLSEKRGLVGKTGHVNREYYFWALGTMNWMGD